MPSVFMDEMFLWTAANLPLMPCASFKISVDGESSSSDSASTVLQACSVSAAARSFTSHLPIHVRTCSRQILHTNIAYNIYHIIYISVYTRTEIPTHTYFALCTRNLSDNSGQSLHHQGGLQLVRLEQRKGQGLQRFLRSIIVVGFDHNGGIWRALAK